MPTEQQENLGLTVFVTGSSTGIGRLTVETAARKGYRVKRLDAEDELDQPGGRRVFEKTGRVGELEGAGVGCGQRRIGQSRGRGSDRRVRAIDVLVNNAGHMAIGLAEGFTEEQVRAQMDVNYLGPFRMCRAVLPHMRAQGSGLLIHVSSIVGRVLFPGCAPYCASKFALEALAEILNYELAGPGIETAIVQPGPFPTRLLSNSPAPLDRERVSGYGGGLATLREDFHKQFEEFFASDDSTDAQDVADAIVDLIGRPPGTRPLRTVVGPDYGAVAINEAIIPIQSETLGALGMDSMKERTS